MGVLLIFACIRSERVLAGAQSNPRASNRWTQSMFALPMWRPSGIETGKFIRKQAGKRHILTSKNRGRKRRLSGSVVVDSAGSATLRRLLPYQ
jgi:large subunit ribosomal protein L35